MPPTPKAKGFYMYDASSFPPTLHSDIIKNATEDKPGGLTGPFPRMCLGCTRHHPDGGKPGGQHATWSAPGLQGHPRPSGDRPSSYCLPPDDPVPAMWHGRPCHAHPSQIGQGVGLTVQCDLCLIPVKKNKCISDAPLKGSCGFLSRSSQRRPPAPRPFISSE